MLKKLLLALLLMGTMLHATVATEENVAEVYIATFDRAPDAAGLDYWLNSGLSLEGISESFFEQDETQKKYPEDTTNTEFVTQVYNNIFDRDPDTAGLVYWVAELDSGKISRSTFILAVANGALGDDKLILNNKTIVGLSFADDGRNDIEEAYAILEGVTADPKTVPITLCVYDLGECPTLVLAVTPAYSQITIEKNIPYTATAVFENGETKDVTANSVWSTSDDIIATIDASGVATGVSVGSVTVIAKLSLNAVEIHSGSASLDVVADDPVFESLSIDGSDVVPLGLTTQLNAIATLSDSSTYTVNDKVNWTSSNDAIATVDAAGMATGIAIGEVVITATGKVDSSIIATHNLSVTEELLTSVQIELGYNPETPQPIDTLDVPITTEVYITAWGIYSDGSRQYINPDTFWWSSDQQIASINSIVSSNVYGRDLGTATITATYEEITASLAVTVVNNGPKLTAITLKTDDGTDVTGGSVDPIPVGFKTWVTAYGTYDDNTTGVNINRYVSYSSSDTSIAYILDATDSNIRGRSEGSAVITAEWQGVSATVTAPVTGLNTIEIQEGCSSSETDIIDADNPLDLVIAEEKCINAWGNYSDDIKRRLTTLVFWKSQDQSIASMDIRQRDSIVTGESNGSTTVSATLEGIVGTAPVNVSADISGIILQKNFVKVEESSIVIGTPPTTATGNADGERLGGGFYYTASTDGTYSAGDLVPNTNFEYDATMTNVKLFVSIYTEQTDTCPTDRISIGEGAYDATVPYTYLTWNEAKNDSALATCALRNFFDGLAHGNFYLRFGDSTYVGTDAFTINRYMVN